MHNAGEGARPITCGKCLYREMTDSAYYQYLCSYLENLEASEKVTEPGYEMRLQQCKECEYLLNGMCRYCGCFVEMRAAVKKQSCPAPSPRWRAE